MKTILSLLLTLPLALAQSRETPVYVEQFTNLHASMEHIFSESSKSPLTPEERQSLLERLFAVKKTAHGLQEQAGGADIEAQKRSQRTDRRLRLIEEGCMTVDGVVTALSDYLATDDKVFWSLAVDFRKITGFIIKVL